MDPSNNDKIKELFPLSIAVMIYSSLGLLLVGAVVLFAFGILYFEYKLGPVLIGMALILFVVSLLSFGLFWVCLKKERLKKQQQPNTDVNMRFGDNCPISIVNPHFDMALPVSPHGVHFESLDHFQSYHSEHEQNQSHFANYSVSDLPSTNIGPVLHEPPPSYWECVPSAPKEA